MMTKQEIFDIVAYGLLKQKKKSKLMNGEYCAYRGENGTKCAIEENLNNSVLDQFQ